MKRIFDAHCHIYPDAIARKAVSAVDRFYDGLPADHGDGTIAMLLRSGNAAGVSHYIVHSVATKPAQVGHINAFIARSVAESNGAFTGLGTLHPASGNQRGEFAALRALGLKGVKLHPDIQRFPIDDPRVMEIFALCEGAGLPVLVHTGDYRYDFSNPNRVVNVLKAFPKLKFIGAHLGGWSVWDEARRVLPEYPNMWVDTSSSFRWLTPEQAKDILRAYGSNRVMFGTDYPMWPLRPDLDMLERLDLTDEEYEDILWRTCARLFDID